MAFSNATYIYLEKGVKWGQTEPNRAKRVQRGPNGGKTGPNVAKQGQIGLNRANLDHMEPIRPCKGLHMSLHLMDKKLKLNRALYLNPRE